MPDKTRGKGWREAPSRGDASGSERPLLRSCRPSRLGAGGTARSCNQASCRSSCGRSAQSAGTGMTSALAPTCPAGQRKAAGAPACWRSPAYVRPATSRRSAAPRSAAWSNRRLQDLRAEGSARRATRALETVEKVVTATPRLDTPRKDATPQPGRVKDQMALSIMNPATSW